MPLYTYQHPQTDETIEVLQKMKDEHTYIDESGVEWKRVFHVPNASIDSESNLDPTDMNGFVERTMKGGMNVGDMWNLSKEMGAKRKKVYGKDPVLEKRKDQYKKRTGKKHPLAKKKPGIIEI